MTTFKPIYIDEENLVLPVLDGQFIVANVTFSDGTTSYEAGVYTDQKGVRRQLTMQGIQGEQGDPGKDALPIKILGETYYDTSLEYEWDTTGLLPLPSFSSTEEGTAFLVDDNKVKGQYDLYIHNYQSDAWVVIDNWGGVPGQTGAAGRGFFPARWQNGYWFLDDYTLVNVGDYIVQVGPETNGYAIGDIRQITQKPTSSTLNTSQAGPVLGNIRGAMGKDGVGIASITPFGNDENGGNIYKITFTNDTFTTFVAPKGAAGNGVASTTISYASSTSGTTAPTSGWQSTIPTVAQGSYLWTRTVITYTNGTSSTSYTSAYQGQDGLGTTTSLSVMDIRSNGNVIPTTDRSVRAFFGNIDSPFPGGSQLYYSGIRVFGWVDGYANWDLIGWAGEPTSVNPLVNVDSPLYIRGNVDGSNPQTGEWRKIYDSKNPPTAEEVGAFDGTLATTTVAGVVYGFTDSNGTYLGRGIIQGAGSDKTLIGFGVRGGNSDKVVVIGTVAEAVNVADFSVIIGDLASSSSSRTVCVGYEANATGSNSVAVGSGASVTTDNTIVLGNSSIQYLKCQATSITSLSDERTKEDIELADLARCLEDVERLPVKRFKFKKFAKPNAVDVHRTGFIAQDVEAVFPKDVLTCEESFPVLDENGEPVMEVVTDENGNIVYEKDGTPRKREKKFTMTDVKHIAMQDGLATLWGAVQYLSQKVKKLEEILFKEED